MAIKEVSGQEALDLKDEPYLEMQTEDLPDDPDSVLLWVWLWDRHKEGPASERLLIDAQKTERSAVEAEIDELARRHGVGLLIRRDAGD